MHPLLQRVLERKLGRRDRQLKDAFQQGPMEEATDLATDMSYANIKELGEAIAAAKDPRQKAILLQEAERLRGLASGLMGPRGQPPVLPGSLVPEQQIMQAPYNPADQRPRVFGGQQEVQPLKQPYPY